MDRLLRNAIQTPDGTILESRTRHDYKEYRDANGWVYMVDGGLDYVRRSVNKHEPEIDLSIEEGDMSHGELCELVTWGTFGKDGNQPLSYITISDMETEHLQAVVDTQTSMYLQIKDLMITELLLRKMRSNV